MAFRCTFGTLALVVAALTLSPAGAEAGIIRDPAADWVAYTGNGSNASGVSGGTAAGWSYARSDSLTGGTKYALAKSRNTGDVGGPGYSFSDTTGRALPAVQGDNWNGGQYELFADGDANSPVVGTDLLVHPDTVNANSDYVFVTYTVGDGVDGLIVDSITGSFRNLPTGGTNSVAVYVLHNNTTLWSATGTGTTLSQAAGTFDLQDDINVSAGDTISFVTYTRGDRAGDETALRAEIMFIPEPSSVILLLCGVIGLALFRRR